MDITNAIGICANQLGWVATSSLEMSRIRTEVDACMLEDPCDLFRCDRHRAQMWMKAWHQPDTLCYLDDALQSCPKPAIILVLDTLCSYGAAADDQVFGAQVRRELGRALDLAQFFIQDLL